MAHAGRSAGDCTWHTSHPPFWTVASVVHVIACATTDRTTDHENGVQQRRRERERERAHAASLRFGERRRTWLLGFIGLGPRVKVFCP